jgi:hypothetical protein
MQTTHDMLNPAKNWAKTIIFLVFLLSLVGVVGIRLSASLEGTDFPDFYCAARMLADGQGHHLYDAGIQRQYQARYSGRVGTLYIHPPFEAVFYLTVAWLPLRGAYLLWFLLNLGFLTFAAMLVAKQALLPWHWRVSLVASLVFVPVLLCLQQGQDSLLLLLLLVLSLAEFRRERDSVAGYWLALALFKFQIVLPLAFVLALTRSGKVRGQFAKAFTLAGLALAGISAAISGWSVFTVYPDFLVHLHELPLAGIVPQSMANLRGLLALCFHGHHSRWAIAAVSVLSAGALIRVLIAWEQASRASQINPDASTRADCDFVFANSVLFALLVSYHLNPHDLSLLLAPISLLLHIILARRPLRLRSLSWGMSGLLAVLFLPPLHLLALRAGAYALLGIPLLALFLARTPVVREDKTTRISQSKTPSQAPDTTPPGPSRGPHPERSIRKLKPAE